MFSMKISGRDNNLNLLRLLAALAVIYTHSFGVTGNGAREPFFGVFGLGPGDVGVNIFFFVSGLLITKSYFGKDLMHFAWARITRIYPGLWVSSILLVVIAGLFWSPLPASQFWQRHETLTYLLRNMTMLPLTGAQMNLPYAFAGPADQFNVSLWTLPQELQMYALLALLGLVGALARSWPAVVVAGIGAASTLVGHLTGHHVLDADRARFLFFFFLGSAVYFYQQRIPLRTAGFIGCLAAIVLTVLITDSQQLRQLALFATLPYMTLWFAYVPDGIIRQWNRLGDYSYGTYIYAFPAQMYLMVSGIATVPSRNLLLTACVVLPVAALSWHLVEKPALGIRCPSLLDRLQRRASPTARG